MPISPKEFERSEILSTTPNLPSSVKTFARKSLHRCIVCRSPDRAVYERNWYNKKTTLKVIALELRCSEQQVSEHMNYHVKQEVQRKVSSEFTDEMAETVVDSVGILKKFITKFDERLTNLFSQDLDPRMEQGLKAISSELRNYVQLLARLEGELQSVPLIQLNQISGEFNILKKFVLAKLCPKCRKKLVEQLPQLAS